MENFWESEEFDTTSQEGQDDAGDDSADEAFSYENVAQDLTQEAAEYEEDDSVLVNDVRLRLEQGKLYEMLLKHDLFGDVDADKRAIRNVQREIRSFIKERLEVLLGIKQDPKLTPPARQGLGLAESQFTDVEVMLIKKLLSKMSNGATERATSVSTQQISPVASTPSSGLNKLQQPKAAAVRVSPKKIKEPASQINISDQKIKKILEEKFGEQEMPLGKPANQIKASELMERNKRISQRQASRKATGPGYSPALTPEQEVMAMTQHVIARNESLQKTGVNPVTLAIGKAISDAQNKE